MAADWFRKTTWSAEDQSAFFERLSRAREFNRPQYLFIQGVTLMESMPPEYDGALVLFEMTLTGYPNNGSAVRAAGSKGKCLELGGKNIEAIDSYRLAIIKHRARPSWGTWAWLDLAWLVAREGLTDYYNEAWSLIHEFNHGSIRFPLTVFRIEATRAFILAERGEVDFAAAAAKAALSAATERRSGLSRHPSLGLVMDIPAAAESRLRAIAGHLV